MMAGSMPKPRIYPIGSRHKLGYWVDKANHDKVAADLKLIGYKNMTELLDHALWLAARRIDRNQWKKGAKYGRLGSLAEGDNQG